MDYIIKATDFNAEVSVFVSKSTNMVEDMRKIHNPTPVVCAAIGRVMTATSMMGSIMKNEKNKLTVIIKGNGDIGNITCTSNYNGYVKVCANNYNVQIPLRQDDNKLDVGRAVGDEGTITVIKDLGLKEPYIGHSKLVNGEIAQDFTNYLLSSEQVSSSVGLGVLVDKDYSIKHSGGFIVSLMPFAKEETINILEDNIKKINSVTSLMEDGKSPEDIANILLGSLGCNILFKKEIRYECDCSKNRMQEALVSIGREELKTIFEEDKKVEINCHFCNKKYFFDEKQLKELIESIV